MTLQVQWSLNKTTKNDRDPKSLSEYIEGIIEDDRPPGGHGESHWVCPGPAPVEDGLGQEHPGGVRGLQHIGVARPREQQVRVRHQDYVVILCMEVT